MNGYRSYLVLSGPVVLLHISKALFASLLKDIWADFCKCQLFPVTRLLPNHPAPKRTNDWQIFLGGSGGK